MAAVIIPEGLYLTPDVITPEQERYLIEWLDSKVWSNELSRRTQHYGYGYNYRSKVLVPGPPLESPLLELGQYLQERGLMVPIQCIVNEYYRSQGIAPHIDNLNFGSVVAGFSIGADATMVFTRGAEEFTIFLPRRSLMVMRGPARTEWKHSIPKTVTYIGPDGDRVTKAHDYRRISLTFRELAH
jgi:alkylated DNA repair dioxygenase AlkB